MVVTTHRHERGRWPLRGVTVNPLLPGRIATNPIAENYGTLEDVERLAACKPVSAGRLADAPYPAAGEGCVGAHPYVTCTRILSIFNPDGIACRERKVHRD